MDDNHQYTKAQRNQEPKVIDTTETGNHPRGNYNTGPVSLDEVVSQVKQDGLAWIDQEDHAKQGMTRKGRVAQAQAAPGHPHIGHKPGSGEIQ